MPSDSSHFAPKDARVFESLARQYENGEYAKGLRTAVSILDRHPNHVDTLCFRGLCELHLGQRDVGFATVKEALRLSKMASGVAWHALGMCHRNERQMVEAIKCFKQCLRLEPTNNTALRDLSTAYIHIRDWEGWLDVRRTIIGQKVNVRANWISLSCAHRMLKQYDLALTVLDVMLAIMEAGENPTEKSELYLYHAELALMAGKPKVALDILNTKATEILPSSDYLLLRAQVQAILGDKGAAEKTYMDLVTKGLHHGEAIAAIAAMRGAKVKALQCPSGSADRDLLVGVLRRVITSVPKCDVASRWLLDVVSISEFRAALIDFIATFVLRMVPSIVSVLKGLYNPRLPNSSERIAIMCEVFSQWEIELESGNYKSFEKAQGGPIQENPVMILSVWVFLATHYRRIGNFTKAHEYIDKAIAHTPTMEVFYLTKAKIFMREGLTSKAAEQADLAARMDRQDKYLNSKAAKYFIRANDIATADARMAMFFKSPSADDAFIVAIEFQCYWYEREVGDAMMRQGDYISALQYYFLFAKHHADTHSELYDFHAYAMRRQTMRQWFDVIEVDDDVTKHPFYLLLCPRIVRCYLAIAHDEATVRSHHKVTRPTVLPKVEGEDESKRAKWLKELQTEVDTSHPLSKAQPYIEALMKHRPDVAATHTLAVEFYEVCDAPLLVLRSLVALARLASDQQLVAEEKFFLEQHVAVLRDRLASGSVEQRVATIAKENGGSLAL